MLLKKCTCTVYFNKRTIDKRIHNSNTANNITDLNSNETITKFKNQLKNEFFYRVPLRYFTDIGKINFPLKTDFRIKCYLKTDMKKLFESKKKCNSNWSAARCTNNFYKTALFTV